jgi:hypothetical protein
MEQQDKRKGFRASQAAELPVTAEDAVVHVDKYSCVQGKPLRMVLY